MPTLYRFFHGDPIAALFAWLSAVAAASIIPDALWFLRESLSEKLSVGTSLIAYFKGEKQLLKEV